jgi:hypothetical protein
MSSSPEQPNLQATKDCFEAIEEVMAGQLTTAELAELLGNDLATGTLGVVHILLTLLALKAGISPAQAATFCRDVIDQAMAKGAA